MKKTKATLIDQNYNTPKTSLLMFEFERAHSTRQPQIQQFDVDGKKVYIIDKFFDADELQMLRTYSNRATFSRSSYGSPKAAEQGEKPARTMNSMEKWLFFSKPPEPIYRLYEWIGAMARAMEATATTLPWELCDQQMYSSPAVIANWMEEMSQKSMELGKHRDTHPQAGLPFSIPSLYAENPTTAHVKFENGATGKPWMLSLMLYTTAGQFSPEYKMGTVFYDQEGSIAYRAACRHGRIVLFESDIFHSIEDSNIASDINTWRTSYVYKLIFNPHREDQNLKTEFALLSALDTKI